MIKSLYTGISGMNAMQNALSVTSNNIANAQTVGYKKQKAVFDDLLYNNTVGSRGDGSYAGTNPKSIGNGVKLSGTDTDYSPGTINPTGVKGNVAIEGNGFFVVGDSRGGNTQYTRKGTFSKSADDYIVNTEGQYVLGYGVDPKTGKVDYLSGVKPISVPLGSAIAGVQTDAAKISGNIPRDVPKVAHEFDAYDSAGKKVSVRIEISQTTTTNQYKYDVFVGGQPVNVPNNTLTFDNTGKLQNGGAVDIPFNTPGSTGTIKLDVSGLSNMPTENTLTSKATTGREAAVAKDYKISDDGDVSVTYSDGSSRVAGQLAVATFPNDNGLMKLGNGNYEPTAAAGVVSIGVSNQNGAGKIKGNSQENSNVDLSVEFVDLMLYQRGFQGNTKVIKVSDDILNEVVNLIR
ncbi:flagellar hook protein FlgE [Bacillus sp. NPDC094106]|uniref:flagellar hook protein FlgE n=1 Tax=Bacillus sp. NPDC094106 TaxID=3363949 RepID=UPI00381DC176